MAWRFFFNPVRLSLFAAAACTLFVSSSLSASHLQCRRTTKKAALAAYHLTLAKVTEALSRKGIGPEHIEVQYQDRGRRNDIGILHFKIRDFEVGTIDYHLVGDQLSFEIQVTPLNRGKGINTLLLQRLLADFPGIHEINGVLTGINEGAFLNSFSLGVNGNQLRRFSEQHETNHTFKENARSLFIDEINKLSTGPTEVREIRQRLIAAFLETPAGKTRARVGFANIASIEITLPDYNRHSPDIFVRCTPGLANDPSKRL